MTLSSRVPLRYRSTALAVLGGAIVAWHGYVVLKLVQTEFGVDYSAVGQAALGVLVFALIPALRWEYLSRQGRRVLWLIEAGLWLALGVAAARDPAILRRSVQATIENQVFGAGRWGVSLVVLGVLLLLALALLAVPDRRHLRFPVTTFVPVVFLLAYLREGAYRVGDGDSLNRMLVQIAPLAVLYLIVSMSIGEWRSRPGVRLSEGQQAR
jgi:hypothetical protein